jgi:hypothetical protein
MNSALCTEVLYPLYGVERRVYEMAVRLPKYGFDTEIFTSSSARHFPTVKVNQVSDPTITIPPKRNYRACAAYVSSLYSTLRKRKGGTMESIAASVSFALLLLAWIVIPIRRTS